MGRKWVAPAVPPFLFFGGGGGGASVVSSNTLSPVPCQVSLDPFSRLATIERHLPKSVGLLCPFRGGGELGPRLAQCGLGRRAEAYLHAKWHIDPSSRLATFGDNTQMLHIQAG